MSRRRTPKKRSVMPDPVYESRLIELIVRQIMRKGKKESERQTTRWKTHSTDLGTTGHQASTGPYHRKSRQLIKHRSGK